VAILLYGFPPGVGATGTAALLNVPRSLEKTLAALHREGYTVGDADAVDGEAIVSALQAQVLSACRRCCSSCNYRDLICTPTSSVLLCTRNSRGWSHRALRASASWGLAMLLRRVQRVWVQKYLLSSSSIC
jgi:cobalamin biosynthesis Mg chelatase CobN